MRLKFAFEPTVGGVWGGEPQDDEHDMVCVRVADFDDAAGRVSPERLTIRNVSRSEQHGRLLRCGDLLLEKSGGGEQTSVGRTVLFDHTFRAVCSNFIALLRPKKEHDPRFLNYTMRALYHGGGSVPHIHQTTGIQNLDCSSYLSRSFSFPEEHEQQRIADVLDTQTAKIDRLMELRRRQMELLREQRAALIQEAVTRGLDPHVPLKESGLPWLGQIPKHWHCTALRRYWEVIDCKHVTVPFLDEGYPLASVSEVQSFELDLTQSKRTSLEFYQLLIEGRRQPRPGDIIYCRNTRCWRCGFRFWERAGRHGARRLPYPLSETEWAIFELPAAERFHVQATRNDSRRSDF